MSFRIRSENTPFPTRLNDAQSIYGIDIKPPNDISENDTLIFDGETWTYGPSVNTCVNTCVNPFPYIFADFKINNAFKGASQIAFSPISKIAVASGLFEQFISTSTDGLTWTQDTNFLQDSVSVEYSPALNLFSSINLKGNEVNTSTDGITWTPQPDAPENFNTDLTWSSDFNKFYTSSPDPVNRVYSSVDGINYIVSPSTRSLRKIASNGLGSLIVGVGGDGPQYSNDGTTWINSSSSIGMNEVAYSSSLGYFVSTNRGNSLGSDTNTYSSTDGDIWTTHPGIPDGNGRSIEWIPSLEIFVIGGDTGLFFSEDGFTFRHIYIGGATLTYYRTKFVEEWGMLFGIHNGSALAYTPKLYIF